MQISVLVTTIISEERQTFLRRWIYSWYQLCAFPLRRVFDDIDDKAWFHSSLIKNIIDENATMKSKIGKKKMCALHEFQIQESSTCWENVPK